MIRMEDLSKKYGTTEVLDQIDLIIEKGEIFGIVGESGAGKSTLLRCINGLETYDSGSLCVGGVNIKELSEGDMLTFRKKIGMIFQNFALLERKTVFENVALPMECWKYDKAEIRQRVMNLLELVGLEKRAGAMPRELSGGQKQRVAIARALTLSPEVLLCDEATSALDPSITKSILELLADINTTMGITVVVVTHEMAVVQELCDRMAIIAGGKIVEKGPVEQLFRDEPKAFLELVGEKRFSLVLGQTVLKMWIGSEDIEKPVLFGAACENLKFSVVASNIDQYKNKRMGYIYLSVENQEAQRFMNYCRSCDVRCIQVKAGLI